MINQNAKWILGTLMFCVCVQASTPQVVGRYTLQELQSLEIGCQKSDIKSVTLRSGSPNECTGEVHIKSMSLAYKSGMSQFFEYPNQDRGRDGTTLTSASFNLLPGTKCLSGISARLSLTGEHNLSCLKRHRIEVSVSR